MRVIYNDFGYGEAAVRDTETMSYVAHLNDQYSVVAIDAYDSNGNGEATRTVACYGDRMVITTQKLEKINPDYIPPYLPAEERAKILADYQGYARAYCSIDMGQFFFLNMFPDAVPTVLDMFGLRWSNAATRALYNDIMELLHDFAYLPVYTKDESAGGTSLQRICAQYNITLPASDYKNILDLMLYGVAAANFRGDENISSTSTEGILTRYTFYAAFYLLADFDVFGRLHAVNPEAADIDLMPAMADLFTKGELDIVGNNLIAGILGSIDFIKENELLGGLVGLTSEELVTTLAALSELELFGLKPLKYISAENGTLQIGALLNGILFGKVGKGVLIDDNPPDNNIVFDFATGGWYALS